MSDFIDVTGLAQSVRAGHLSAQYAIEVCLEAIEQENPTLNAFVFVGAEAAIGAAKEIDRSVSQGHDPGPLAGVPFGVKDLEDCVGMPTSHGSLWFKGSAPAAQDSIHVRRLREAGAIPVGKTAASEFGMDSATSTKAWGVTRNPRRLDSTPGGSSGGSAAAVAGGLVPIATGSDGGGSIRSPAAFCGLVGLKPSYGRIPKSSPSMAQVSCPAVLVQTVRDCARHLDIASGPDGRDRSSFPKPSVLYEEVITDSDVRGLRAAWSGDLGFAPVEPEVLHVSYDAARALIDAARLTTRNTDLLDFPDVVEVWVETAVVDLWAAFQDNELWPSRAGELCDLTRDFMQDHPPPSYKEMVATFKRRADVQSRTAQLFLEIDVVFTPTVAVSGFKAEGPLPRLIEGVVTPYGPELFTMWANLTGLPAISIPAGVSSDGLPIGLQIVAGQHREDILLRLARIFEDAQPWPTTPILGLEASSR